MSGSVQVSSASIGRRPPNMRGARVMDHSVIAVVCSSRVRNVGDAGPYTPLALLACIIVPSGSMSQSGKLLLTPMR